MRHVAYFLMNDTLNSQQAEAVSHVNGPSIVLAGAGSGKTRILISKVAHLVKTEHVDPHSILMITFTNKAAREMKERIMKMSHGLVSLGYVGTFHSFCAQILRRDGVHLGLEHTFSIYDDDDQSSLIRSLIKKYDGKRITPSYVMYRISGAKNQMVTPARYLEIFSDYNAATVAAIYEEYEKELVKSNAVDFDDLIMKVNLLFSTFPKVLEKYQERYQHILVDEFQDTNFAQYLLTKQLGERYKNVTVVGDFSQSIYSWRGADIRNLEKFEQDFPDVKTYHLERNYRSTQTILDFAYEVISKNQTHPILHLKTGNSKGEDIEFFEAENEEEESVFISKEIERLNNGGVEYKDIAVLYRTNAQSRSVEEGFLHYGVPYMLIGGTRFYERKEIKDILSYLRLIVNPTDELALNRIKKIGMKRFKSYKDIYTELSAQKHELSTVEIIDRVMRGTNYLELYNQDDPEDYARLENIKELKSVAISCPDIIEFLEQVSLVESEYFEGEKKTGKSHEDGVRLMTLHQAKGLEFEYVFIIGLEEGILPHARAIHDLLELEEERRLFYVGITRAKHKLYITYARRRFIFGRRSEGMKSRFIRSSDESDDWM